MIYTFKEIFVIKRKAQSLLFFLSAMRSADNRTLVRPTSRKKKVAQDFF